MTARGRSFDEAAGRYAVARPDYPTAALDWLLPAKARRVLDLGAGTGKLTRQLVDRGLDVVAVEPSPQLRAELLAYVPEADLRDGTAEQIPSAAADVDAALVGQAFYWFDDSAPWVDALAAPTGTTARADQLEPAVVATAQFVDPEIAEFPHGQLLTDLAGRESFVLPYVTRCWRATRR